MNEAPNLDAMTHDELMAFWLKHQGGRANLFTGRGSRTQTGNLACYASNKAVAMGCRLRGDISTALMYEGICDRIYDRLPEFARW